MTRYSNSYILLCNDNKVKRLFLMLNEGKDCCFSLPLFFDPKSTKEKKKKKSYVIVFTS